MDEKKKCYIGVVVEKELRLKEDGEIYLYNVESFTDWAYYDDWKSAYADMESRIILFNQKQFGRSDKHRFGYYQRSLADVYCVSEPCVR